MFKFVKLSGQWVNVDHIATVLFDPGTRDVPSSCEVIFTGEERTRTLLDKEDVKKLWGILEGNQV
jgi:hypothetical protein